MLSIKIVQTLFSSKTTKKKQTEKSLKIGRKTNRERETLIFCSSNSVMKKKRSMKIAIQPETLNDMPVLSSIFFQEYINWLIASSKMKFQLVKENAPFSHFYSSEKASSGQYFFFTMLFNGLVEGWIGH